MSSILHLKSLIAYLMKEKTLKESLATMEEEEEKHANLPKPIKDAYARMQDGYFLDALNRFQMYLHKNRNNHDAMRGECLALLFVGNTRMAREKIERWMAAEPDDLEAKDLYKSLLAGEWDEGGARREQALKITKEHIGKGVTMIEMAKKGSFS